MAFLDSFPFLSLPSPRQMSANGPSGYDENEMWACGRGESKVEELFIEGAESLQLPFSLPPNFKSIVTWKCTSWIDG